MNKLEYLTQAFNALRSNGIVRTQKDFAEMLDVSASQMSKALKGDEQNLSDNLIGKLQAVLKGQPLPKFSMDDNLPEYVCAEGKEYIMKVIPTEAMAGTLGEFASSINQYECERMVSPIKGVDYAIKVCGDSMSPEIPNGSQILIKRIFEEQFVEWGKIYCLDTQNGAVIKKVFPTEEKDEVECRSINPDYPPFRIKGKYINGWYRVLMVLALK